MRLIIVESPTKSKTLQSFLGKDYLVRSSYGHIRDLPQKELGVDVKQDFKPKYVIPSRAKKRLQELRAYSSKARGVILAVDEDREGEAIAWHLAHALGLKDPKRIVFHEITKQAIKEALKNPRDIDMNLVNAQQARRILDRLVGYKLSPFLWRKVVRGLSAGRVQSVAVRLVCEREKEIENFVPQEYWTIAALLLKDKSKEFEAILAKKDGKVIPKLGIKTKQEADSIVKDLGEAEYKVASIEKKEVKRNPLPPFTTSTLQQDAWSKLRFSAKRTMMIAQGLYERGLISYHRSDSLNLSSISQQVAKKFIQERYGQNYWPGFNRIYKTKSKLAQEAHEAIRPTEPTKTPDTVKDKLYDLIWRRFMACQMSQGIFDSSQVDISATPKESLRLPTGQENYTFRATGQILKFDGFLKVYPMKFQENELPSLEKNEVLDLEKLISSQHFTQPPPRYNEATLVKTLEKEGIGRPSTYAPILDTIQRRTYVEKNENKKFEPTEIGVLVNDILVKHFPKIVDIKFTAKMEDDLDKIATGKENWVETLEDFYTPFEKNLKQKEKEVSKEKLVEKTDKICPKCKGAVVIRWGRFGKFYACSQYPKCKYTDNLPKPSLNIKCPKCKKGEIVEKRTKKGKIFYGCSAWPKCDFALWDKPLPGRQAGTGKTCPECGSLLVETKRKQIHPVKSSEAGAKQFNGVKCSNKECDFKR